MAEHFSKFGGGLTSDLKWGELEALLLVGLLLLTRVHKPYPISEESGQKLYVISDQNISETL